MRPRPFRAKGKKLGPAALQRLANFVFALVKLFRGFRNRVPLNQNIFSAKLALRIAAGGSIAFRQNAIMKIENSRVAAEG